jgi:glycerate 2-kinase
MELVRNDAEKIIKGAIQAVLPDSAVKVALLNKEFKNDIVLVSIGKAAWSMANTAKKVLKEKITKGFVITKYGHSMGDIDSIEIIEAGHPILDENTIIGTQKIIELISNLKKTDEVLFLVSGGGSALFEKPIKGVTLKDIEEITQLLLACGADIVEINTIRKRLSAVKGGKFAELVAPNNIFTVVLSDVVGDRLDSIASGPAYPDGSNFQDVANIIQKYNLEIAPSILEKLKIETPKELSNVETVITGSVKSLCEETAKIAKELGYEPTILTYSLGCEAKEAGRFIGAIARDIKMQSTFKTPCAIIVGGETIVNLIGSGKGGRNQEFALSAANEISGLSDVIIFSLGSDGTDGPTDAAGGIVDGTTKTKLLEKNIKIDLVLQNNASYEALKEVNGLIITGPTGTNVNDVAVILCK